MTFLRYWFDARVRRLMSPVLPHWLMGLSAGAAASFLGAIDPLLGRVIIDDALGKRNASVLWGMLALMGGTTILGVLFDALNRFLVTTASDQVRMAMQARLAERELAGRAVSRDFMGQALAEAAEACRFLLIIPSQVMRAMAQIAWIGAVLLVTSPPVALATAVAAALLVLPSRWLSARISSAAAADLAAGNAAAGRLGLIASAGSLFRKRHRSDEALAELTAAHGRSRSTAAGAQAWEAAFSAQQILWSYLLTVTITVLTGQAVIGGTLTIGQYIAISIFVARVQGPIRALLDHYKDAHKGSRYLEDLLGADEPAARLPGRDLASLPPAGVLRARGLAGSFLDGADFEVAPGARVLFVADGDESLEELLAFIEGSAKPRLGTIAVGGVMLEGLSESGLRRWATRIEAEPRLLPGSLRENLTLGARVPAAELGAALELSGLSGRFTLDEPLRGVDRAARQRLELARALVSGAELLIVEDFTGALDPAETQSILKAIALAGRTVVCAGRRAALLELVDAVVWVERGRCEPAAAVDAFLASPRASRLVPRGRLSDALAGRGAVEQARRWAERNRLGLARFTVELFGEGADDALLESVSRAVSSEVRGADLVMPSGRSSLRCVFLGDRHNEAPDVATIERRLVRVVDGAVRAHGGRRAWFVVQPEEGSSSARRAA